MPILRTTFVLASLTILVGCSSESDVDTAAPGFRISVDHEVGETEAELRRAVGPPTSEHPGENSVCHQPARSALMYEIKFKGFTKLVQDIFNVSPSQFTVVCVDKDGIVTEIMGITVD